MFRSPLSAYSGADLNAALFLLPIHSSSSIESTTITFTVWHCVFSDGTYPDGSRARTCQSGELKTIHCLVLFTLFYILQSKKRKILLNRYVRVKVCFFNHSGQFFSISKIRRWAQDYSGVGVELQASIPTPMSICINANYFLFLNTLC